jgi:ribosome maturation factor RimP
MNIEQIKNLTNEVLSKHQLKIYSIKTKQEAGLMILEILLDIESINIEELEPIHYEVLDAINDLLPDDYFLELSSLGVERPLNSLTEVKEAIGAYVYLKSDYYTGYATIKDVIDEIVIITYQQKNKSTDLNVKYSAISQIRKAIKF